MELIKVQNEMENFIKLIEAKKDGIIEILDRLSVQVDSISNQLRVFATVNQCTIPARILQDFSDVKRRVIVNLVGIINSEIRVIIGTTDKLYNFIKELRKFQEKIGRLVFEIDWAVHALYYAAFYKILDWTEKCWKSLHFLYTNVNNGIKFVACDQSHSAVHMKRISEIKIFDRSILLAAPEMLHLLNMVKTDQSSRAQNTARFS